MFHHKVAYLLNKECVHKNTCYKICLAKSNILTDTKSKMHNNDCRYKPSLFRCGCNSLDMLGMY